MSPNKTRRAPDVITHASVSIRTGRYEPTARDKYNACRLTGSYKAIVDSEWDKVFAIRKANREAGRPEKSGAEYEAAYERVQEVWRDQTYAKLLRTIARKDKIVDKLPRQWELRTREDRARHFARQLNASSPF